SAHRAGSTAIEQALGALQHLPRSRDVLEQGVDLRLRMRHSLILLAEHQRALDHMREAERLAIELDDVPRRGWGAFARSVTLSTVEDLEQGLSYAQRALSIAEETQDGLLECAASFSLGAARLWLGQYQTAILHLSRCAEIARSYSSGSDGPPRTGPG